MMSTPDVSPKKTCRLWRILFRIFCGLAACFVALMAVCALCLACKARSDVRRIAAETAGSATTEQLMAVSGSLESFQTQVVTDYNLLVSAVNEQNKVLTAMAPSLSETTAPADETRAVGIYRGACVDPAHATGVPMTLVFTAWADGKIRGVMKVAGLVLTDGGKFEGVCKDNHLSFVSHGEGIGIAWNGVLRDGRLTGAYVVSKYVTDTTEIGTWSAETAPAPAMPEPVDAVSPGV